MKTTYLNSQAYNPYRRRPPLAAKIQVTLWTLALTSLAFVSPTKADNDNHERHHQPDLPSPACEKLDVPEDNRVSAHFYALGVQIYRWSGTNWMFVGPEAALFADPCYNKQVGIHYGGPTWEANDGSKVTAAPQADCTPFRGAIPWLRLVATSTSGRGEFARVTYIQRLNTIGGTAPEEPGAFAGDEARVPYTAEYYFYFTSKR